jgi:hypothetical protein
MSKMHKSGKFEGVVSKLRAGGEVFWAEHMGEKNPCSKFWELESPTGEVYNIRNLSYFIRENQEWFNARPKIVYNNFIKIKRSMQGKEEKNPIYSYKGWKLNSWSDKESNS